MVNDITLENVLDKNLKPLKSKDKSTSIEVSEKDNGARVSGDLEVTGGIVGNFKNDDYTTDGVYDIKADQIHLHTDYLALTEDGVNYGRVTLDGSDIIVRCPSGALTLDATDEMVFKANGNFIMKNGSTEFSPANSAYAGMILGYTKIDAGGTLGVFESISTSWISLLWGSGYGKVSFVVPPSNKVEISVFLPYCSLNGNQLNLGLATDDSATSLGTQYENKAWDVDETDTVAINYSWVVDGSDHSWSAGESKTLYIMGEGGGTIRLYTGGSNTEKYGNVSVKAVALPATISDGT